MPVLDETLQHALGVEPLKITPLHGGCVAEVYAVDLPASNPYGTNKLVVKVSNSQNATLGIEGRMLTYLKNHSTLPVPEVFHNSDPLLVMAWLPGDSRFSAKAQMHAAELLAELHQVSTSRFGFEYDTLIGGLPQPNPWTDSWLNFFREARILHMARLAYAEKRLSLNLLNRLEHFCNRMAEWLDEPAHPALLHGDAWTTNILAQEDKITAFLDPAIYYGHPEIELAFTTLFGTFDAPFFQRYTEINPIAPGFFELRKDLYNLYPLLVHVRLFGSSYASGIDRTLKHIGL